MTNTADIVGIANLLVAFLNIILGCFVLKKGIKKVNNVVYALVVLTLSLWTLSLYFYCNPIYFDAKNWLKIVYVNAYIMILTQGLFVYYYPQKSKLAFWKYFFVIIGLMLIGLYALFIKDSVIINVFNTPQDHISIANMGSGYYIYALPVFLGIGFLAYFFTVKGRTFTGYEKSQINLYVIGALSMMIPVLILDFILPFLFNFTDWYRISPLSNIVFTIIVGYSMLQNRFFGMRSAIGKLLQNILTGAFVYFFFYALAYFQIRLFGTLFSLENYIFGVIVAPAFLLIYSYIRRKIQEFVETKFIYILFNPASALREFSARTSTELDLKPLVAILIEILAKSLHLKGVMVVMAETGRKRMIVDEKIDSAVFWEAGDIFPICSEIFSCIKPRILIASEIARGIELAEVNKNQVKRLHKYVSRNGIAAIIPILRINALEGYILIGEKDSEEAFNIEEIDFLNTIGDSASVAIGRSYIHLQLEELNQTLRNKVDAQTKALREKVAEIEQRHQKEEDMLNILGHELRTPLSIARNATVMNLKYMGSRIWNKDKIKSYTEMTYEHIDREIRNLETILSTTRIDNAKVQLVYENIDFLDVVHDSLDGLTQRAKSKGLDLRVKLPEKSTIWADRTKIQEIADNLIENSIKYTDKGFVKIEIQNHPENGTVSLIVSDSGIGMSKADLKKLGKKFFRCNEYIGEGKYSIVRPGGTGLGLYVTFALIKMMKGKYVVTSELGKGSAFNVTMPIGRTEQPK